MASVESINERLRLRRVRWHDHDGQVVILGSGARSFALNPTAALLWRRLAEGADREQLVGELTAAFGIDETIAGSDVDDFVDDLRSSGLLAEDL